MSVFARIARLSNEFSPVPSGRRCGKMQRLFSRKVKKIRSNLSNTTVLRPPVDFA